GVAKLGIVHVPRRTRPRRRPDPARRSTARDTMLRTNSYAIEYYQRKYPARFFAFRAARIDSIAWDDIAFNCITPITGRRASPTRSVRPCHAGGGRAAGSAGRRRSSRAALFAPHARIA